MYVRRDITLYITLFIFIMNNRGCVDNKLQQNHKSAHNHKVVIFVELSSLVIVVSSIHRGTWAVYLLEQLYAWLLLQ